MQADRSKVLTLEDVSMRFGHTQVLHQLNLSMAQGERLALIGPNGAGKSTLFELISGRLQATGGKIWIHGRCIKGLADHQVSRLGVGRSFQTNRLFAGLSVTDNLSVACLGADRLRHAFWLRSAQRASIRRRVDNVLEQLGLASHADALAGSLSYAQQRALEIGLAVAGEAPLVLLDEPTSGMSRSETSYFVELIRRITGGRSLLMIEHDMDVVFSLADRIAVLNQGRLLACDTPQAVRSDALVQKAYLGAMLKTANQVPNAAN